MMESIDSIIQSDIDFIVDDNLLIYSEDGSELDEDDDGRYMLPPQIVFNGKIYILSK